MQHQFWHDKWRKNEIGFHLQEVNPLLVEHFNCLNLASGSRVFLPLCGKTLDIDWLLSLGLFVIGSELSSIAIEQLFERLGLEPAITVEKNLVCYHAGNLVVFQGDFFELTKEHIGRVDAVYDRAALVALPSDVREQYAHHLGLISQCVQQLLIAIEYDQEAMGGPPFSIVEREIAHLYSASYALKPLAHQPMIGGLKGKCPAAERVWHLSPLIR